MPAILAGGTRSGCTRMHRIVFPRAALAAHFRAAPARPDCPVAGSAPSFFAGPASFEQAHDRTPLFLPDSCGPTPFTYRTPTPFSREPTAFRQAAPYQSNPLFLPDSRGPTPFTYRTPTPFTREPTVFPQAAPRQSASGPRQSTSARAPSRSPSRSPSPPRKRRRRDGAATFFDLEASDSDLDNDEEDDVLVMTQQDLDFIDDAPLPQSVQPLERQIQRRDIVDSEELAEHYNQQAASYCRTWRRKSSTSAGRPRNDAQTGAYFAYFASARERERRPHGVPTQTTAPPASKDAVEIGTWICFRESRKSKPILAFTVANNQVLLKRETVRFPRPLLKARNPCVFPTIEEVAPFLGAFHEFREVMTAAQFIGPALRCNQETVQCVTPRWYPHQADVWITQIQDFVQEGSDRYTRLKGAPIEGKDVSPLCGDDAIVYCGDDALVQGWHPLNLLKRHVLCPSPTPRILDHVCVTGAHRGMDGGVAWIVQIQDILEIPSGQMITLKGEDDEMFEIELSRLRREFRLGDEVVVARGDLKSRKGFVTVIHPGAVLEIFDKLHTLVSKMKQLDQERTELTERVVRRFEGLEVLVVGAQGTYRHIDAYKASVFKGKRGTIIADFDSKERAERLKQQDLKLRQKIRGDTRGIMATVRETGSAQFQVGIEKLVHAAYQNAPAAGPSPLLAQLVAQADSGDSLSPAAMVSPCDEAFGGLGGILAHTLVGEDTGAWLCTAAVVHKRVDVLIKGVAGWAGTKEMSTSAKLQRVEGKHGVVLLSELFAESHFKRTKFKVYRVGGDGGLPQQVPGQFLLPLRIGEDGRSIVEVAQRVLVLGGDIENDKSKVGEYAEMQPHIQHSHHDKVVAVRFELGSSGFYHELALCRSTNKAIDSPEHSFPATSFQLRRLVI
ncbi:hypothetical protein B0H17DRAFT_1203475 [Mycena rosella]|uniref:Uncharacterized protein n=1 Tax=Mycena rosella TaxID=1033263 RepID=A0AAD7GH27_MYCRO|nr:hypothetical protein B0H17DRAFT_1203475 [Mycena rosella]